jgi:RNA polymerase sigma-70 factor (ECF subfamily)
MGDDGGLVSLFEASRPRLRAVAHRMLGSESEADDAVQETWIRLSRTDSDRIENLGGWLTMVISRVCLDRLRSRRARHEDPTGSQLTDEIATADTDADPEDQALIAESVGAAMLVVLDLLPPAERVAFVLHDVFAVPFDQVASILDRSPDAARQLASRARRRVQGRTPVAQLDLVRQRRAVDAFLRAAQGGDFDALLELLDPDVELRPDAAALRMGALRQMRGAAEVANALSGGARGALMAIVDGLAALVWAPGGKTRGVIEFELEGDKIVALEVTGDAARIGKLEIVIVDDAVEPSAPVTSPRDDPS